MMDVPYFYPMDMSEEMTRDANAIYRNLHNLHSQPDLLRSALMLYHTSANTITQKNGIKSAKEMAPLLAVRHWTIFAQRVGAMIIYDYQQLAQAIDILMKKVPDWDARIDKEALKAANKLFDATFPNFAKVRTGAAHAARMTNFPKNTKQNAIEEYDSEIPAISGKVKGLTIIGSSLNGEYTHTIDGKIVSYRLNEDTVRALEEITDLRMKSVAPLEQSQGFAPHQK